MDTELFELCTEVYKRTAWYGTVNLITKDGPTMIGPMSEDSPPLYTSDYLLEKLPKKLESRPAYWLDIGPFDDSTWGARYAVVDDHEWLCAADTPLKALLKLVIALDEAGELNHA